MTHPRYASSAPALLVASREQHRGGHAYRAGILPGAAEIGGFSGYPGFRLGHCQNFGQQLSRCTTHDAPPHGLLRPSSSSASAEGIEHKPSSKQRALRALQTTGTDLAQDFWPTKLILSAAPGRRRYSSTSPHSTSLRRRWAARRLISPRATPEIAPDTASLPPRSHAGPGWMLD